MLLTNAKPFADKYEAEFDVALDVMQSVVESWRERKKPFWVFVQAQPGWQLELSKIVDN